MKPKLYVPKQSESVAQQNLIRWFRMQYPRHTIFAIPNGAWFPQMSQARRIGYGAKRKREGLLAGVSDLFIPVVRIKTIHEFIKIGLFLEMKAEGKTLCSVTKEQRLFMKDMRKQGYCTAWAAGFDEAKEIIETYMKGVT